MRSKAGDSLVRGDEARSAETDAAQEPSDRAELWAVCTLIATTPATAREAEHTLSAAAARPGLSEAALAAGVLDASRGPPVPACAERRCARPSARYAPLTPYRPLARTGFVHVQQQRLLMGFSSGWSESLHAVAALDDHQDQGERGQPVLDQTAGVAAVGPDQGQRRDRPHPQR